MTIYVPIGRFSLMIREESSVSNFSATLSQLERRIMTAIRTVSHENVNNVRIRLYNQLHAAICVLGGHVEHQCYLRKTS